MCPGRLDNSVKDQVVEVIFGAAPLVAPFDQMSFEDTFKAVVFTFALLLGLTAWLVYKLKVVPLKVERLPKKPRPEYVRSIIVGSIFTSL